MIDFIKQKIYSSGYYKFYDRQKTKTLRKEILAEGKRSALDFDIHSCKSSDTIFILGSSYSIMSHQKKDWDFIGQHNSFGLNGWIFDDFIPTFYGIEPMPSDEVFNWYLNAIRAKPDAFKNTPIFVQYQHLKMRNKSFEQPGIPQNQLYYNAPYMPNTTNADVLEKMVNKWVSVTHTDFSEVFHYAGSISYAIAMSYIMGYKNIVLMGIDLKDLNYFYQSPNASKLAKSFNEFQEGRPLIAQRDKSKTHNTNSKSITSKYGCLPISTLIGFMKTAMAKEGVELYTSNKESALYPLLNHYSFPK